MLLKEETSNGVTCSSILDKLMVYSIMRKLHFVLPLILVLLLCSCEKEIEKPFDIKMAIGRMNSVSVNPGIPVQAEGFSKYLAVPDDADFNAEGLLSPACLLVSLNTDEAQAYKNPYARTYPASITKLMTALVCLENVEDLNEEFLITSNSVIKEAGSSTAFLQSGERMRIEDLLYGMLLPSGNDAAVAVAEATAGSVSDFVRIMNERALALGCTGTHFVNPHGLPDDNHYTTPYDIYIILNEVMKYDEFRTIASTVTYNVKYKDRNGMPKSQVWNGTNLFLTGEREEPDGVNVLFGKTGTTKKAGYCLALAAEREASNEEFIAISMKEESKDALYGDLTELLSRSH